MKEATHVRTKKRYAVKIMNVAKDGDADEGMTMDEIAEEIRLTMSIQHENIVKVYDFYQTKRIVYVIMELLEGGELLEAVMELGSYQERDAACIMKQLLIGLESIHEKAMAHRDLKLENLILARPNDLNSVRIADFGLAKKMRNARGKLSAQCGSPAYVAPEVIAGQQYTPAVDMWGGGMHHVRAPVRRTAVLRRGRAGDVQAHHAREDARALGGHLRGRDGPHQGLARSRRGEPAHRRGGARAQVDLRRAVVEKF